MEKKETVKLKNCPFCGARAELIKNHIELSTRSGCDITVGWVIRCTNCSTRKGPCYSEYKIMGDETLVVDKDYYTGEYIDGLAKVIEEWNNRVNE